MPYHVNEKQEIKECSADPRNPESTGCKFGLSSDRHFLTSDSAIQFVEKQEHDQNSLFPLNASTQKKPRRQRAMRNNEPPTMSYDPDAYVRDEIHQDVMQRGDIPFEEDPNSRLHDDPDARYIGAQLRSLKKSAVPPFHRNRKPQPHEITVDEQRLKLSVDKSGRLHHFNKPAYQDSEVSIFYDQGIVHRDPDDGPALTYANNRGHVYIYHGLFHNPNGAAVVMPDRSEWWMNGLKHRTGGPAVIHDNGRLEFWEKGVHVRTMEPDVGNVPDSMFRRRERVYGATDKGSAA